MQRFLFRRTRVTIKITGKQGILQKQGFYLATVLLPSTGNSLSARAWLDDVFSVAAAVTAHSIQRVARMIRGKISDIGLV